MKNNKGFASTFILFGLLALFLVVMSILLFTMNNSSVLNRGLKVKLINDVETKIDKEIGLVSINLYLNDGILDNENGWTRKEKDNKVFLNKEYDRSNNDGIVLPTATKNGYRFVGWNTKEDGTGTTYNTTNAYIFNYNMTLYAKWEVSDVIVTYQLSPTGNWISCNSSNIYKSGIPINWNYSFNFSVRGNVPSLGEYHWVAGSGDANAFGFYITNKNHFALIINGTAVAESGAILKANSPFQMTLSWNATTKTWLFRVSLSYTTDVFERTGTSTMTGTSSSVVYVGTNNASNWNQMYVDYVGYSTVYKYGEKQTRVPTPTRTGKTFRGFSANSSTFTAPAITSSTAVPATDTKYYGYWQ